MNSSHQRGGPVAPLLDASVLPLAGRSYDRDAVRREQRDLVADSYASSSARALVMRGSQVPVTGGSLVLPALADLPAPTGDPARPDVYLGRLGDGSQVILRSFPEDTQIPGLDGVRWEGLRGLATVVDPEQTSLLVTAQAVGLWHRDHPRCPRCGAATEVLRSGWARRCTVDGSLHFPRTDPAIIVAVVEEHPDPARQRLLLGRSAAWSGNRYSTLAGFVEPGESAEQAVVREVGEEAGITVHSVHYQGSQPWPFPRSLMLGFRAVASSTDAVADGEEILDVRWFTREELTACARDGRITLPGRASIAHALIVSWLGRDLPESGW